MTVRRIWLIGCGNMGGAMLARWIESGTLDPADVTVIDIADRPLPAGVVQRRDLPDGEPPDLVLLGVKPQQLDAVVAAHGERLASAKLLVSILAGVEEATLINRLSVASVVRAVPNLPVAIGRGVVALNSGSADAAQRDAVAALMAPLGLVEWVEAGQLNLVTALAGSGPAFLYRLIDALAAGGAALGLPADQAARLSLATVEGAAMLAAGAEAAPSVLADRVASPGGSTRKGLDVLDEDHALGRLIEATLAATTRRNQELAAGQ